MKIEHILIIHLDRSKDREVNINNIKKLFDKIPVTIIKAVDGQKLTDQELNDCKIFRGRIRLQYYKAKCGVFLSHQKALQYVIDNNLNNALILEDDVFYIGKKSIEEYEQPKTDITQL